VYFEEEPGRRSGAHLLTRDEARRIAPNIAKLAGAARRDDSVWFPAIARACALLRTPRNASTRSGSAEA
jgi:hypothetical protein